MTHGESPTRPRTAAVKGEPWKRFVAGSVERVSSISRDEFEARYRGHAPLIIAGGAAGWPALGRWDPDYLAATAGSALVTVGCYGLDRRDYGGVTPAEMHFGELLDRLSRRDAEGVRYLFNHPSCVIARNEAHPELHVGWGERVNPGLASLGEDIEVPAFLAPDDYVLALLIVGSGDNATRLHYDRGGEAKALAQIRGRKRVLLFPPAAAPALQLHSMFPSRGGGPTAPANQGAVDIHDPGLDPLSGPAGPRCLEAEIGPGDVLYWPAFWLHDVANLGGLNVAVSLVVDEVRASALLLRHHLHATLRVFDRILRPRVAAAGAGERGELRAGEADISWNGVPIMTLLELFHEYERLLLSEEFARKRHLWDWNHALFW